MRKFLSRTIMLLLAAVIFAVAAACSCGGSDWDKDDVTLTDWGKVLNNGGFIAETENYVYYINGAGDSTEDNTFGKPIKGSLVAAKKSDIKEGKKTVEKCIVVPKLFAAQDYKSGLFIKGDYVYYATPSTDKTSSGDAASDEIQFMKTKLDGTESEKLLKAGNISDQYRIFESNDVVYIAVYDSANTRLLCYNVSTKNTVEIMKTDEKTEENESLDAYFFAESDFAANGTVVFTTTVYKEKYDENAAESNSSYSRATESYNKVYVYKAGDEAAKKVLDGADGKNTFTLMQVSGEYLYYTKTVKGLTDETPAYAVKITDLYNGAAGDRIYNTDYVSSSNIVISPEEIYTIDSDSVKKVSLFDAAKKNEQKVAKVGDSTTLLFVDGGYIYYFNSSNELLRVKMDIDAKYEKISEGAVNSSWYAPKVFDFDGNKFAFYSDSTAEGCGYIKAVSLSDNNLVKVDAEGKKTSKADEVDHGYFKNSISLGIFTEADTTTAVGEKINAITSGLNGGKLVFDTDDDGNVVLVDGTPVISAIPEIRAAYDNLSKDNKKEIEENYKTFIKYEKAYEISKLLYKLNDFDKLSDDAKTAKKADYEAAKAALEGIKSEDYTASEIKALCVENLMWFYQTAETYFK